MIKKSFLIGVGAVALATIPTFSVVSCSSSNTTLRTFISDETNKKYYENIWGVPTEEGGGYYDYPNRVITSLQKRDHIHYRHSYNQVLQIAKAKLDNLTKDEIKEFLIISSIKGAQKIKNYQNNLNGTQEVKYDVQNIEFNPTQKEVSFTYVIEGDDNLKYKNKQANVRQSWSIRFHNFKLKEKVVEDNVIEATTGYRKRVYIPAFNLEATETSKIEYIDSYYNENGGRSIFRQLAEDSGHWPDYGDELYKDLITRLKLRAYGPRYLKDQLAKIRKSDKKISFSSYGNSILALEVPLFRVDKLGFETSRYGKPEDIYNIYDIKEVPGWYVYAAEAILSSPIIMAKDYQFNQDQPVIKWDVYSSSY